MRFDYDIVYKKGKENLVVDALSTLHNNNQTSNLLPSEIKEWKIHVLKINIFSPLFKQSSRTPITMRATLGTMGGYKNRENMR